MHVFILACRLMSTSLHLLRRSSMDLCVCASVGVDECLAPLLLNPLAVDFLSFLFRSRGASEPAGMGNCSRLCVVDRVKEY